MDDPWGSPWAADDTHPKIDLPALPPQVHTPQTPQKLPSPWGADAEDDAWGGWNAAEGAGGADSPGWGRSPGLRPMRSGTVSRHVSPEPWGRTGTLEARSGAAEEREEQKDAPGTVDSAISLGEDSFAIQIPETKQEIEHLEVLPTVASEEGTRAEPRISISTDDTRETREESPIERVDSPTGEPSPATSAPERPEATRQTSKVQELVHMYDGIAKRKDSPGEPLQAGPRIVLVGSDEVADEPAAKSRPTTDGTQLPTTKRTPDWVDDGPAQDQPEVTSSDVESFENSGAELDVTPDDAVPAKEPEKLGDDKTPIDISEPIHSLSSNVKVPSAPYSYDLKYLDELFPSTETPRTDPEPVPDVIIDDTFASISERKAWYRISRRGPMRQHNQGNDDDYVRLDWRSSEVRGRTLRIVRRWMEEDSIAGRVVLGRRTGPVGASMFNWDSQAPQVEIGELLRKKSHRRSVSGASSKASKGSLHSSSSASFGWGNDGTAFAGKQSMDEPKRNSWISAPPSAASPVAPFFGWSSEPQGTTAPRVQSGAADGPALDRAIPPPISVPSGRSIQSLDRAVANGPSTAGLTGQTIPEANEEDEDEWGEMVSSPTWPGDQPSVRNAALTTLDNVVQVEQDPLPARGPVAVKARELDATPAPSQTNLPSAKATASPSKGVNPKQATPAASTSEMDMWAVAERDTNTSTGLAPYAADAEKVASTSHSSNLTADEEAVVHRIIAGLPDLAYMLR